MFIIRNKYAARSRDFTEEPKKNGLTPTKKKTYNVNGKDDSLLHATDGGDGGGGGEEKEPEKSSPTISQSDVRYTNMKDDVELGNVDS